MRNDKIIIIFYYHFLCTILFLCKSESGNLISFWAKHDLFCFISSKRNLILFHFIKKKSDSVSFHKIRIQFCLISWKMNLVLFHLTEKRFSSVSSHQKKIWFCLISQKKNLISFWFWSGTKSDQNEKSWFLQSVYTRKLSMKLSLKHN